MTIKYGFKGNEFETKDWKEKGFLLYQNRKRLINKLNIIYKTVKTEGIGKNRIYILDGLRNLVNEEEAIKLTIKYGYVGNEFETKAWKENGWLIDAQAKRLVKKLETIYDTVNLFGQSSNRWYEVDNLKHKIEVDYEFIKNFKPKNKPKKATVKPLKPVISEAEKKLIKQEKEKFLENYFIKNIKKYKGQERYKRLVHVYFEPRTIYSKKLVKNLYKKHQVTFDYNWDQYMSYIIELVTQAIDAFRPTTNDFKWEELNVDGSKSNNTLYKFINTYIKNGIITARHDYLGEKVSSKWENGVNKKVILRYPIDSIDILLELDNEPGNFQEILGNEKNFFGKKDKYVFDYFLHWFSQNKNNILLEQQIKFLDEIAPYYKEQGSNYTPDIKDDFTLPYNYKTIHSRIKRIRDKVKIFWLEAEPSIKTRLKIKKENDLKLLNKLIHIAYEQEYDSVHELNKDITKYIYEQLNNSSNTVLSDLLHDRLDVNDLIEMNTILHNNGVLNNRLIYKIVSLVESKIKQLEQFDTSVSKSDLRSNLGWTKEDHDRYQRYLREFKNQPVKVYNKDGKLIRVERGKPGKKNFIVMQLDTYGIRYIKDDKTDFI